jgi:hypothetical protein
MAKKPTISTISSGYASNTQLNNNFSALRTGFDNTLSLDGSTPNAMNADFDMNSNDILNANEINTSSLRLNGVLVSASGEVDVTSSIMSSDVFTGNGSTTVYTLSFAPFIKDNTQIYIDGVYQNKITYSTSGNTLTFTEAPPLNSAIEVMTARILTDVGTADAGSVTYTQGASGSVQTTVQAKLQETVSVKDFGAVGDGVTDDTAAIQAAVDANLQSIIYFPNSTYKITSPIQLNTNVFLQGEVFNFGGTQIVPYDCAAFVIDGDLVPGGYAFNVRIKDMFINCTNVTNSQDYIVYLNNAYRVELENIRIQNAIVSSSDVASIVKVRGTNFVNTLHRVYAIGTSNSGSGAGFDISVGEGNLVVDTCDSENLNRGFQIAMNSQIDLRSPYTERVGVGLYIVPTTLTSQGQPQLNVYGGYFNIPSATSVGILFNGTFNKNEIINFYGIRFGSNDHATKNVAFNTGALVWSNSNRININGVDWSWISRPDSLRTSAYITPDNPYLNTVQNKEEQIFKITNLADNTATDVFKIEGMTTGAPYPPVYLKVRVYESFNGWGRALEESVFLIQDRSDQSAFTTTKQVIASVQETGAANYSISTLSMTATENTDNVTFSVTSDFNTAIIATMPEVYFYVTMVGTGQLTLL